MSLRLKVMIKKNCWIKTLLGLILSSELVNAQENFVKGLAVNDGNISQLAVNSLPYAASFCGWDNPCSVNTSYPLAFFETEVENFYYALKSDNQIVSFNTGSEEFFIGWSLINWSHQLYSYNIEKTHETLGEIYPPIGSYSGVGLSLGCLGDAPLRYGDLESDGINELIIYNGMFTLFSPQYQRTVFAAYLSESDWVTQEDAIRKFDEDVPGAYQYVSKLLTNNDGVGAAIRSYSKLYIGNYDGDTHSDILVWRKEYRSNLKTNHINGFTQN